MRAQFGETSSATYFVSDEVKTELGRLLAVEGSIYAKIKDAVADPIKGDWLRESLADGDRQPLR